MSKNKIPIGNWVIIGIFFLSTFLIGWTSNFSSPGFKTYETIKKDKENLLRVKVACWYQSITDYNAFNRTIDDVISHLKETKTDFIFRAFWKYKVIPETCSDLPLNQRKRCEKAGYSYENFEKSVEKIKKEISSIIISAGIPTERIDVNEYNPITGKKYTKTELWKMALNPARWNIINPRTGEPLTKEQFQFNRGKLLGFFPFSWTSPSEYNWKEVYAYYPDITNPEFQKLQLSWAKKMIDSGADAIWIDMLFAQARMFYELTKNPYHPAVKEFYEAALKQIDEIHKYARKKGKYIYVGGWTNFLEIKDKNGKPAYPVPDFDFVVNMIWEDEVRNKNLSEKRWNTFFRKVKKYIGDDTLILVFMDEAAVRWQDQPLGIFSQYLNKTEQAKFLEIADRFFCEKRKEFKLPIIFVYPLHGGWMGNDTEILSFGKFKVYDSLAPEFKTYETIKELARNKAGENLTIRMKEVVKTTYHLDVIDLRGKDYKTRILALSLQGIVNRDKPRLYVLWESKDKFGNPSQEWLKYYKSKGWIEFKEISVREAIRKYKNRIKGFVVYDPDFKHSINIATTMAGLRDILIAHPYFIKFLKRLGLKMVEDLRGKWKDKYESYKWQLIHLFPECNKNFIAILPVEHPFTHKSAYYMIRPIRDYVIMNKICALDLIPHKKFSQDTQLLDKYYKKINPYGIVLGYPFSGSLERPHVEFASKHKLKVLLSHVTSVNFSVHSKMPGKKIYRQDDIKEVNLDKNKIYIAFCMSDLGLNTMQDRYYGAWDDPERGSIPVSWWLDAIVVDFCPGIVQYYYETKTQNDFFYGAHVAGRIRASDFPDLEEYLRKGKLYLKRCDLNTVAFSNHGKYDEYVFKEYSKILDNCIGFFYGWMPEWEFGKDKTLLFFEDKVWIVTSVGAEKDVKRTVQKISSFIKKHKQRPLFMTVLVVLGNYPDFTFLKEVKENITQLYPEEIEWVRGDELLLLATEFMKRKK